MLQLKLGCENTNQKIGTYPYIPPEVNKFCEINKEINEKNNEKKEIYGM